MLGDRKQHERTFMANPLAAAAVCALADRDKYRDAILATLRHYDYEQIADCRVACVDITAIIVV